MRPFRWSGLFILLIALITISCSKNEPPNWWEIPCGEKDTTAIKRNDYYLYQRGGKDSVYIRAGFNLFEDGDSLVYRIGSSHPDNADLFTYEERVANWPAKKGSHYVEVMGQLRGPFCRYLLVDIWRQGKLYCNFKVRLERTGAP